MLPPTRVSCVRVHKQHSHNARQMPSTLPLLSTFVTPSLGPSLPLSLSVSSGYQEATRGVRPGRPGISRPREDHGAQRGGEQEPYRSPASLLQTGSEDHRRRMKSACWFRAHVWFHNLQQNQNQATQGIFPRRFQVSSDQRETTKKRIACFILRFKLIDGKDNPSMNTRR